MDEEALQLTQQLLLSNPDFSTLWNYRREILTHLDTVRSAHYASLSVPSPAIHHRLCNSVSL